MQYRVTWNRCSAWPRKVDDGLWARMSRDSVDEVIAVNFRGWLERRRFPVCREEFIYIEEWREEKYVPVVRISVGATVLAAMCDSSARIFMPMGSLSDALTSLLHDHDGGLAEQWAFLAKNLVEGNPKPFISEA